MTYGQTTRYIFEALATAGHDGVNTEVVMVTARKDGIELNRSSISSQLRRLHRGGMLDHEPPQPERYRLKD